SRGRGFHHVERAFGQHFEGKPWLLGALRDADRGLMEHNVARRAQFLDEVAVANVSLDDFQRKGSHGLIQVRLAAAREIVEHDDGFRALPCGKVGNVGTDQTGSAGYENALTLHWREPFRLLRLPRAFASA